MVGCGYISTWKLKARGLQGLKSRVGYKDILSLKTKKRTIMKML